MSDDDLDMSILRRLVEPTDPVERSLAIKICRANCGMDPETGLPETDKARSRKTWEALYWYLPREKWLWMWNHGRFEWDPRFMPENTADHSSDA